MNMVTDFYSWTRLLSHRTNKIGKSVYPIILSIAIGTIYQPTPPLGQDMTQGQFLSGV